MKRCLVIAACLVSFVVSHQSLANDEASTDRVEQILISIQESVTKLLDRGVYEADRPRVFVLKQSAEKALVRYQEQPLHRETFYLIFNLYVRFKISHDFFQFIRTGFNAATIDTLYQDYDALQKELGLDDSPFMRIIATNLEQMLAAVQIVSRHEQVSGDLQKKMAALIPELGKAISVANNGDRPSAFREAARIYILVRGHYTELESELAGSQVLFIYYMEIIGINEFIGDFAEVEGE